MSDDPQFFNKLKNLIAHGRPQDFPDYFQIMKIVSYHSPEPTNRLNRYFWYLPKNLQSQYLAAAAPGDGHFKWKYVKKAKGEQSKNMEAMVDAIAKYHMWSKREVLENWDLLDLQGLARHLGMEKEVYFELGLDWEEVQEPEKKDGPLKRWF